MAVSLIDQSLRREELERREEADHLFASASPRLRRVLMGVLSLVVVGGITDLILDRPRTWYSAHVVFELTLILVSLACVVALWIGWWRSARDLADAQVSLDVARRTLAERQAERDAWRASAEQALTGLATAIDAQFDTWGLTRAERDVVVQLLKGHSHKAIAAQTGRSERTVRQHAATAYQKAGVRGRAELAAYFLEGLAL
jgi:DNA-binding CsgD family transcriptional regulator